MSVVAYHIGCYCFNLAKITSVFIRTRSFSQTFEYFTNLMSGSIDTDSCEIVGSDYGMLKPRSPELSTKSEVICSFTFKEPVAGTVRTLRN